MVYLLSFCLKILAWQAEDKTYLNSKVPQQGSEINLLLIRVDFCESIVLISFSRNRSGYRQHSINGNIHSKGILGLNGALINSVTN